MRTTTEALTVDFAVGVRFAFTYQLHVCSFKFSSGDNVKSQDTLKARNTIVNYVISLASWYEMTSTTLHKAPIPTHVGLHNYSDKERDITVKGQTTWFNY